MQQQSCSYSGANQPAETRSGGTELTPDESSIHIDSVSCQATIAVEASPDGTHHGHHYFKIIIAGFVLTQLSPEKVRTVVRSDNDPRD